MRYHSSCLKTPHKSVEQLTQKIDWSKARPAQMDTPRANLEKLQDCGVWARRPADVAGLCHVLSLLQPQPVVRIGGGQLLQADHLHNHGSCPAPLDLTFMRKTTMTTCRLILVFLSVCSSFHSLATM